MKDSYQAVGLKDTGATRRYEQQQKNRSVCCACRFWSDGESSERGAAGLETTLATDMSKVWSAMKGAT